MFYVGVWKFVKSDISIEMSSKRILEVIKLVFIIWDNLKEVEKLFGNISNDEYFLVDIICFYLGLRKEFYIRFKESFLKNLYCDCC